MLSPTLPFSDNANEMGNFSDHAPRGRAVLERGTSTDLVQAESHKRRALRRAAADRALNLLDDYPGRGMCRHDLCLMLRWLLPTRRLGGGLGEQKP
jgi:hypothetical protein